MGSPPEQKPLFLFCLPLIDTCHRDPQNAFFQDPCSSRSWLRRETLSRPLECTLLLLEYGPEAYSRHILLLTTYSLGTDKTATLTGYHAHQELVSPSTKANALPSPRLADVARPLRGTRSSTKQTYAPSHQIPQVSSKPIPSGSQLLSSRLLQPVKTIVSHIARHCAIALAAASDTPVPLGRPTRVGRV